MAKIEIDETQFQQSEKLRATVAAILAKPDARRKMLEAQRAAFPDEPIPELDNLKPVDEAVSKIAKDFEDFKKAQAEKEAKAESDRRLNDLETRWASGRETLKSKYKVTKEGLDKVEELMKAHNIIDHEIGWAYFEKLNPPPPVAVPSSGYGSWSLMDETTASAEPHMKALIESKGDDEQALNKLIGIALDEVRGAR